MNTEKKFELKLTNSKLKNKLIIASRMRKSPSLALLMILMIFVFVLYLFVGRSKITDAKSIVNYVSNKKDHTKITFTGDVSPSRYLKEVSKKHGPDIFYENVKRVWQDSDISIANIEAAVIEDPSKYKDQVVRMDRRRIYLDINKADIEAIKRSGIKLFGYANNHSIDYGIPALLETLDIFNQVGVKYTGVGYNLEEAIKPASFDINGKKISITAITDKVPVRYTKGNNLPRVNTTTYYYADFEMKKTFSKHSFNIVFIHWGTEYSISPGRHLEELGRHLIDLGADLVIGSHPHVLLPVEKYKDGFIAYSMGNLVFDQLIGRTTDSTLASLYMNEEERFMEFVPVVIEQGVPEITDKSGDIKRIFSYLTRGLSREDYVIKDGKLRIDF